MLEQEIKLHVPLAARKTMQSALEALPGGRTMHLRALYFDTPARSLARQHAALRVRLEGEQWVQTFKIAGDDRLSRIELNHPAAGPALDLSVYEGTPAAPILADVKDELGVRYETDVLRMTRLVGTRAGQVELAWDVGSIQAGRLAVPVHELEFELVSGESSAVFGLARRWLRKHALVLDARSKAERGDRLAEANLLINACTRDEDMASAWQAAIGLYWGPRQAESFAWQRDDDAGLALARIAGLCFDQIARNATMLAEVDTGEHVPPQSGPEHLHQLRVGIRRLRSAWRLFEGWPVPLPAKLQEDAQALFALFGPARDHDVITENIVPRLRAAGMPDVRLPSPSEGVSFAEVCGDPAFQGWLLSLLEWIAQMVNAPKGEDETGNAAKKSADAEIVRHARHALRSLHKKLARDGRKIESMDDEAPHTLRKQAKRLRYGLSYAACLFNEPRLKPYIKQLAIVQDELGEINDLAVARRHYQALAETEPAAWFAVGWIGARLESLAARAHRAMMDLAALPLFWK